ncbi:MAG: hypothetical protein JNM52_05000, partial [Betaproteobacteria bacterium]|nr:hypothetical protein [Betaproteobacteria bacterium]
GGAVGLKTSQEATGLVVSMGAVITDENSMSIELSFADSTLRSLTRENSGQGAFVQNPNIDIFGLLRSIRLQSGETALVTMLRRDVDQSTKRRLGDSWVPLLFGGSDTVKTERQVIFLLVEGVIEG